MPDHEDIARPNTSASDEEIQVKPTSEGDVMVNVEIGASGTAFFSGFIQGDEFVPRLKGMQGRRTFDKMFRSDPIVSATARAVMLPIQATTWDLVGGSERGRELVTKNILPTWRRRLPEILMHLIHGFALFERVYKIEGNQVVEAKFAQRLATSIERWWVKNRELHEVEQFAQIDDDGGQEHVRIPARRLTRYTNEQEGDNFEGKSTLRSSYKPWFIKDATEKIMAIQSERFGLGVPVGTAPKTAGNQDKTNFKKALEMLRSHENAYFFLPEGFKFEFAAYPNTGIDLVERIQHLSADIAISEFSQFLLLGMQGKGGSRALATGSVNFALLANQHVAEFIEEVTFEDRIVPLGELNTIPKSELPRLRAGTLRQMDHKVVSEAVSKLVGASAMTPDEVLENALRKKLNLPERKTQIAPGRQLTERKVLGEATEAEEYFVNYAEITRTLDGAKKKLEDKVEAIRLRATKVARSFLKGPIRNKDLTGIRKLTFQRFREELREAFLKDTLALKDDGRRTVVSELKAQEDKSVNPFDLVRKRGSGERVLTMQIDITKIPLDDENLTEFLTLRAQEQADFLIGSWESTIKISALNAARDLKAEELFEEELASIGRGTAKNTVAFSVANAFTMGRAVEAAQQLPRIESAWYSAILDGGTCEVCRPLHRQKHAPGDPDFRTPNPLCLGSLKCRCITVYKLG